MTPLESSLFWCARGGFPIPVPYRAKNPNREGWPKLRIGPKDCPKYFNGCKLNIGVLLGEPLADIDLDCPEAISIWPAFAPDTGVSFGRASAPASHWIYNCDPPQSSMAFSDPLSEVKGEKLLELRCQTLDGTVGNQSIVPTSFHKDTGEEIRFEPGKDQYPANVEWGDLKRAASTAAAAALFARHWPAKGRHDTMLALAGVLCRAGWPEGDAKVFCRAVYRAVATHDRTQLTRSDGEVHSTYAKIAADRAVTGIPTLAQHLDRKVIDAALRWLDIQTLPFSAGQAAGTQAGPNPQRPEKAPNLLSGFDPEDVGNAQRLIAMYGPSLRYCHAFKKWLVWDSRRWEVDESDQARELTHRTMTEFALQAVKANNEALTKFAAGCRRVARITNAMREAQPYLGIKPADLDTHPDLINFMNGTVDLRTERLMSHRPEDFITKMIRYNYLPEATCPVFHAFLERITGGGPDASEAALERSHRLIRWLQKAFGYSLTGHTIAKAVFLLHGRGDNGKSTLLSTFLRLLKEYSVLLQIDTLMVRQESNNTSADLADLRGARFVMTSETEEGQRLAEGKLKRITQGMGEIKATRKYENPIVFSESHKLWIDANHLPIIRGTDDAIWNRFHPIPFDVAIPKDEQDPDLQNKLMAEAEGILAWAVTGAARYYRERLGKPPDIERAGQAWRAESDQVGRFIEACCVRGDYCQVKSRALYLAYKSWAEEAGERFIETEQMFFKRLVDQGFTSEHTKVGNVYLGVGLITGCEGR